MTPTQIHALADRIANAVYNVIDGPLPQDPDVDSNWYMRTAIHAVIVKELRTFQKPPVDTRPSAPQC